jgi:hypothetical protein
MNGIVQIRRWEFFALVVNAFLLIAAIATIISLMRPVDIRTFRPVFAFAMFFTVAMVTMPVLSVAVRLYYRHEIDVRALIVWAIATAMLLGTITSFVVR